MKILKRSKDIKYHSHYNGYIWGSRGKNIFKSNDFGNTWEKQYDIPMLSNINKVSLFNRLTRSGVSNLLNIDGNTQVVCIKKNLLLYRDNELVKVFEIKRGSRPIRQCITVHNEFVIYGDYWNNAERKPANVYIIDTKKLVSETLITINDVRHVHFIIPSINKVNNFYIGTGDYNNECKIFEYNLSTKNIQIIGEGNQSWRAVSILEDETYLYWGTDAPDDDNFIYKYHKLSKIKTPIIQVAGPIFYSCKNSEGHLFFASTVEYKKKHKALIYKISKEGKVKVIKEFKKDILSQYFFGFGTIDFIHGQENLKNIYINTHGLI